MKRSNFQVSDNVKKFFEFYDFYLRTAANYRICGALMRTPKKADVWSILFLGNLRVDYGVFSS